jgi:hypothetical protein
MLRRLGLSICLLALTQAAVMQLRGYPEHIAPFYRYDWTPRREPQTEERAGSGSRESNACRSERLRLEHF